MTGLDAKLYVIDAGRGGRLWRVDVQTLTDEDVGQEDDWPQPQCMAGAGIRLFVIDAGNGGELWRVDPGTLGAEAYGPDYAWPQAQLPAASRTAEASATAMNPRGTRRTTRAPC